MTDQHRIDELVRYYNKFTAEERRHKATSIGCYRPTRIDVLRELFEQLHGEGFLESFDIFLDAGGGDARVSALASLYDLRSYSVEGDYHTHTLAEKRIAGLQREGILEEASTLEYPILKYGDFLEMKTYVQLRLRPQAIDIVFNGGDNETALARFMKQHMSRKPAYLILTQSIGTAVERELCLLETYTGSHGDYLGKIFSS